MVAWTCAWSVTPSGLDVWIDAVSTFAALSEVERAVLAEALETPTASIILGIAETYVAWAIYGGKGRPKGEPEPKASEILWTPEYNPYE